MVERIQSNSKKLCETLQTKYPGSDNVAELKASEEKLIKAYYAACSSHLKTLKNVVKKFIAIPDNVLANEDKLQEVQYTETELQCMHEKLEELQQKAKQVIMLNVALKEEIQLIEQFSICLDNTDRLRHIIESAVTCSNGSEIISQLVENYKQLSAILDNDPSVENMIYNSVNYKHTDTDINTF
ncbi:hypothetical protein PUN28_013165 [Cardiocondyla obscurior]